MIYLFEYIFKLSLSLAVVYAFYFFVLRRLTFYDCNRWYLLFYSVACFYIPFLDINALMNIFKIGDNQVLNSMPAFDLNNLHLVKDTNLDQPVFIAFLLKILPVFLIGGTAIFLFKLVVQYLSYLKLKRSAILINQNGVKIYQVQKAIIPFSMGNSIFINIGLNNSDELKEIIRHEFIHVKQRHSMDILFSEILCILNWYNPFAWFIRHAIRQNLEFIADNNVVKNGFDKKQYQYLLLKVIGASPYNIATAFNFSSLKKRIIMLNKIKTTRIHLIKFLFVLPLVVVLLLSFRNKQLINKVSIQPILSFNNGIDTIPNDFKLPKSVKRISINNNRISIFLKNGSTENFDLTNANDMIGYEKKYGILPPPPPPPPLSPAPPSVPNEPAPASVFPDATPPPPPPAPPAPPVPPADVNSSTSKQTLKPIYLVDGKEIADGADVNNINPETIKSVEVFKGEKAISLFGNRGKNGVVKITLKDKKAETAGNVSKTNGLSNTSANLINNQPTVAVGDTTLNGVVFFIDGKESTKAAMLKLNSADILSVDVLKGITATKEYGDSGKNGVIKITTKQHQ